MPVEPNRVDALGQAATEVFDAAIRAAEAAYDRSSDACVVCGSPKRHHKAKCKLGKYVSAKRAFDKCKKRGG